MAIFPVLSLDDDTVQISDSIRFDATRSFVSKDEAAITLVEVEPESGVGFVDVTGTKNTDWYLDWQYAGASRVAVVSVRVTTDGVPVTFTRNIQVLTEADDKLFSSDTDILKEESEILKFLPKGKTSFLYMHRRAQKFIVEHFNERGVTDTECNRLTKDSFVDIEEVKQWSIALTLSLIFKDNSNVVGDNYSVKSDEYKAMAKNHIDRAFFRFDRNNDGTLGKLEGGPIQTVGLVRR